MSSPGEEFMRSAEPSAPRRGVVPLAVGGAVLMLLALGGFMMTRADASTNKIALASSPKPVSVVLARGTTYRPSRSYVGTLEPWTQANIGPQLVSAYIDTVLVRPGAVVKRGEVLATLDCRDASAGQAAVANEARAIEAKQRALANEASRTQGLLDGGFVSPNEAEQKSAASAEQLAQLEATKAKLTSSALQVNDCVLRAPFDGEISRRTMDPGAFVHPGTPIVSLVDRDTIRLTADAPEIDFGVVGPGTPVTVHLYATNQDRDAVIARRAPAADPNTRTVHFEIDLADPKREIPVGTTGEVRIQVGAPLPASEVPLSAATVRGAKATLFVVEGNIARRKTFAVTGEAFGSLFLEPALTPGTRVVAEGRALLDDGDPVAAQEMPAASASLAAPNQAPGSPPPSAEPSLARGDRGAQP